MNDGGQSHRCTSGKGGILNNLLDLTLSVGNALNIIISYQPLKV